MSTQMGYAVPTPNEDEDGGSGSSVTVVGPVEVANDVGNPLPVDGTVALDSATLAALETIGLDTATLLALETISISTFPADYPDAAVLAKVEAVRALLAAPLVVTTTDLDIRNLTESADGVRSVDAAETVGLTAVPFTITATGVTTLVAAPGGTSLLRLRRLSPTFAIRSPDSEPILQLKVGAVEVQRGNALVGRFDVTAAAASDAITLTVDILDASGKVTGTVYYEELS